MTDIEDPCCEGGSCCSRNDGTGCCCSRPTRQGMGRRKLIDGSEYDAMTRWGRKYLIYLQRAGVRAGIKRKIRRRERHQAKQALRLDPPSSG